MKLTIDTPVVASKIDWDTKKSLSPCKNDDPEYSEKAENTIAKRNEGHKGFMDKKGEYLESYFPSSHPCDTKGKVYMFRVSKDENNKPLISKNDGDGKEHLVALPCPDFCTNSIPEDEN